MRPRKLLNPEAGPTAARPKFVSYAQNHEDVLLWRAFKDVSEGFYVDVGAAHPSDESVTKAFYDRGWRGINIEANPRFHALLEKHRPRDVNICALAGGSPGQRELLVPSYPGLATACPEYIGRMEAQGQGLSDRVSCEVLRLDDILTRHGAAEIHFLKVDAEGMEPEVFEGCSLTAFRPKVLVVEATAPETNVRRQDGLGERLEGLGYNFVFFDGLNDYFVAAECPYLTEAFALPVNVLDNFQTAAEARLEKRFRWILGAERWWRAWTHKLRSGARFTRASGDRTTPGG